MIGTLGSLCVQALDWRVRRSPLDGMAWPLVVVVADPDVVQAILGVLHDGFRIVPVELLRRASVEDILAAESLLQSELEMTDASALRSLRGCAEAAQMFLDSRPEWGT